MPSVPWRLGATSYVIPAGLAENACYLSGKADDMEMVLFDLEDGTHNLPDARTAADLLACAASGGLSFTVHLPLDLSWQPGETEHPSLVKARKVIAATRSLQPYAYVAHLDQTDLPAHAPAHAVQRWQDQALYALEHIAAQLQEPRRLALENLESFPPDRNDAILARLPISRCIDVGHLWRDERDPLPWLQAGIDRTRVIHLHGAAQTDHISLRHMPAAEIDRVLCFLYQHQYAGVLTLEVFGTEDFLSSRQVYQQRLEEMPCQEK